MKKYTYVPHPVAVTPLLHDSSPAFELTGVGPIAFRHAPALFRAIEVMGRYGLGHFRYSISRRLEITPHDIRPLEDSPVGYSAADIPHHHDDTPDSWHVVFETPTIIKHKGAVMLPATFSTRALIRSVLFRLSLLSHFHCLRSGGPPADPLGLDYRSLLDGFSSATISDVFLYEFHAERFSARQGRTHPINGITGSLVITSEAFRAIAHLLPLARLFGVGKFATYGFGRIRFLPVR